MSNFYLFEDTLVRADNQLVKISDLKEGMEVQSFVIVDRLFYHGVVNKINKKDNCSFLKLSAGKRELIATENTPIITSKGDGYVWRELKDYQPGNLMLIQNKDSTLSFHEPIISLEDFGQGSGYSVELSRYDNFVAEGFPVHTKDLPHEKENHYFNF
jgi:intein/homing endonuclease